MKMSADDMKKYPKFVFIVGVTLLHELCHLGNYKLNTVEAKEAGFAMETAVYGQSVP